MLINTLLLILGLILIIVGANFLTDGAALIARKLNVSEFVIGLTIVALGTSAPELVVSITSALAGNSEMALGNVIGSNIFNALVIIGVVSLIRPIRLSRENCFETIPATLYSSLLLILLSLYIYGVKSMPTQIEWWGGVILLTGFCIFIYRNVFLGRGKTISNESKSTKNIITNRQLVIATAMVVFGLLGLIFGGDIFLENGAMLAESFGVSKYVISVTLMAAGTSMPELVACVVAARKGKSQMALGNILGSNIANILLVLGSSATISPISLKSSSFVDITLVVMSTLMLIAATRTFRRFQIDRIEGFIFLVIYGGYLFYLLS